MKRVLLAGVALVLVVVLAALAARYWIALQLHREVDASPPTSKALEGVTDADRGTAAPGERGFLYGRVTTDDGGTYKGRLRWKGTEEAFWSDHFNGAKIANPWAEWVPEEHLQVEEPFEIFGFQVGTEVRDIDLDRPFMVRFGDIVRIEEVPGGMAQIERLGGDVRVTLKSGAEFVLDRLEAGDMDDGVRVWDEERGVVDLEPHRIRTIELLPTRPFEGAPERLHGTVRTRSGTFTGTLQWDREAAMGSDELVGRVAEGSSGSRARGKEGEVRLRFDTLRSLERVSEKSARLTLGDGSSVELSGSRALGRGNRGIDVDDPRYGRVQIPWDALEGIDFASGDAPLDSGPGYDEFPPGGPLWGTVTTRSGQRLTGRLVYDLDESRTVETLDAPGRGIDYSIPFGRIAAIRLADADGRPLDPAQVTLRDGTTLRLDRVGDLGVETAGLLVFPGGSGEGEGEPEYVPWDGVVGIDLDPLDG